MTRLDDSHLPLERRVPPDVVGSPSQMPASHQAGEVQWYKPSLEETARLLGWRWLYFLPAVALLALVVLYLPFDLRVLNLLLGWWKLWVIAVVLPLTLFVATAKQIIRERREPFCIHCGYTVTGLPDGHPCPECGVPFSLAVIEEYRRDPDWFIERWKQNQKLPMQSVAFEAGKVRRRKKSRDGT